jgi:hypothetical protein
VGIETQKANPTFRDSIYDWYSADGNQTHQHKAHCRPESSTTALFVDIKGFTKCYVALLKKKKNRAVVILVSPNAGLVVFNACMWAHAGSCHITLRPYHGGTTRHGQWEFRKM